MAYDLVTWSPRISGAGDDRYNIPGATKLDGSVDTGLPTRIDAGDGSGFSAIPTIAQINASSGVNQVIAAINRRILNHNGSYGSTLPSIAYIATGARILASKFAEMMQRITQIKQIEGFVNVTALTPPTSGQRILGSHLAVMRQALAISGELRPQIADGSGTGYGIASQARQYTRVDNPYGTLVSDAIGGASFQAEWDYSGGIYTRSRQLQNYAIPEWLSAANSATLKITAAVTTNPTATSHAFQVYNASPAPDINSLSSSDFDLTSSLLYSLAIPGFSPAGNTTDVGISVASIIAAAGVGYSLLTGFDFDFANAGSSVTGFIRASMILQGVPDGALVIDLG